MRQFQSKRWLLASLTLAVAGLVVPGAAPVSATLPLELAHGLTLGGRWTAIATSSSGEVAVAARDYSSSSGSKLYITVDRGSSWTSLDASASLDWTSVDISADGQTIVAAGNDGMASPSQVTHAVFRSTNRGLTWTTLLTGSDPYPTVSMSGDGQTILVTDPDASNPPDSNGNPVSNGRMKASTDGGTSWSNVAPGENWRAVVVSGDGNTMYASNHVDLWKSTDDGATWSRLTAAGSHMFSSVSTSNDGSVVLGVVSYEQAASTPTAALYSRDGGATFQEGAGVAATFQNQIAVGAVSGDGSTLIAASYGSVPQMSVDGGVTWASNLFMANGWLTFAVSDSGSVVHGAAEGGGAYVIRPVPGPTISSVSRTSVGSAGGQSVQVFGTSFVNMQSFTYGGQVPQYTVLGGGTEIHFETLPTTGSSVTFTVTTATGTASYTLPVYESGAPVIDSLTPVNGDWVGGTHVRVVGNNLDDITSVKVGGVAAELDFDSPEEATFWVPEGRVGLADIEVTTSFGSTTVPRAFRYTYTRRSVLPPWEPMGSDFLFDDYVTAVAPGPDGKLYFGGYFDDGAGIPEADSVIAWDGTNWEALGSDGFDDGALSSLSRVFSIVFDPAGRMFAAGVMRLPGDSNQGVLMWDGATWSSLGGGLDGVVYDLAIDSSGNLIAVGGFPGTRSGMSIPRIARWDGTTWSRVSQADLLSVLPKAVAVDGDDIFVSGDFENLAGVAEADYVARWDGTNWHALGSDGSGNGRFDSESEVLEIEGTGSSRRVLLAPIGENSVFAFESGQWSNVSSTELDGEILDVERLDDGRLVAVGDFDGVDDPNIRGIAVLQDGAWAPAGEVPGASSIAEFGSPSRLALGSYQDLIGTVDDYVAVTGVIDSFRGSRPTSFEPGFGPVEGGTSVTIRGTDFSDLTDVTFGDLPATSVTLVSPTEIRAVAPAQGPVTVILSVYDPVQLTELRTTFRYGPSSVVSAPPLPVTPTPTPAFLPATGSRTVPVGVWLTIGVVAILSGSMLVRRRSVDGRQRG